MGDQGMTKKAAIVIIAFDRAVALSRLLTSLANAVYQGGKDIPLVISIDNGGSPDVEVVAGKFVWEHGSKRVIKHNRNLGLREHVLFCGDLSSEYGAVVVLEDDLFVSPYFYEYVNASISFFESSDRVCQISLYSPEINEFARRPFLPVKDGYDNYFIQSASSWGQIWTARYWQGFREWYHQTAKKKYIQWAGVPSMVKDWPESSWKKYFIKYMHERNMFSVYPGVSLTTNWGDDGEHMKSAGVRFQVPLLLANKRYRFCEIESSISQYDAFFEPCEVLLKKLAPWCQNIQESIEADFYGLKQPCDINSEILVSVKNCSDPTLSFGEQMHPPVSNVIFEVPGKDFAVGKALHFKGLSYKFRFKILLETTKWVGCAGLVNGIKRRVIKCLKFK